MAHSSTDGPKGLLLDIETFPDVSYNWTAYESNAVAVKEHWFVLSFSAKWLDGEHITRGYWNYRDKTDHDRGLVQHIHRLLNQADFVIAHNGARFDIRKLNARFIVHGLQPPSPYAIVDTKRQVKRVADFSSNKLDWLCSQLHLGRKVEHEGFNLWLGCVNGDRESRARMLKYNRHDVVLLEKLYRLLSPWMKQPNAGMWNNGTICSNPACQSQRLRSDGWRRNNITLYRRVKCLDCGQNMRIPQSEKRDKPLVGI